VSATPTRVGATKDVGFGGSFGDSRTNSKLYPDRPEVAEYFCLAACAKLLPAFEPTRPRPDRVLGPFYMGQLYLLTETLYGRSTLYISFMTENSSVPANPAVGL
jgi:hypothetical protein